MQVPTVGRLQTMHLVACVCWEWQSAAGSLPTPSQPHKNGPWSWSTSSPGEKWVFRVVYSHGSFSCIVYLHSASESTEIALNVWPP